MISLPHHSHHQHTINTPLPTNKRDAYFAMGCFWGAEHIFAHLPGIIATEVGYMGGNVDNPSYEEVCRHHTGHAETVHLIYDPHIMPYEKLCAIFFENHDPTQVDRQGNDHGPQYRSAIFPTDRQQYVIAHKIKASMEKVIQDNWGRSIATQISAKNYTFFRAEDYHQHYLEKHPGGYCAHGPNGLQCPLETKHIQDATSE